VNPSFRQLAGLPVFSLLALAACSNADDSPRAEASGRGKDFVAPTIANAPVVAHTPGACSIVTAREMSDALGAAVDSRENNTFNNQTSCTYSTPDGDRTVFFQVEWGQADGMDAAFAIAAAPGSVATTGDDLGDGYRQMGSSLWIRVGSDLVTLQTSGVGDEHAIARRIVALARPRMAGTGQASG
jgi:hypothetical protein